MAHIPGAARRKALKLLRRGVRLHARLTYLYETAEHAKGMDTYRKAIKKLGKQG